MNQSPQAQVQEVAFSVLSLDGGGVKGLSSLLILRGVMVKVIGHDKEPIYPWKYFKIICGTSTGGLIALMLGRLRMSIDEAIAAYEKLGEEIFSPKKWWWKEGRYKATNLERAVKRIVGESQSRGETREDGECGEAKDSILKRMLSGNGKKQRMQDEENEKKGEGVMMLDGREDACMTFVCTMTTAVLSGPSHLRTYAAYANATSNCKIWEAARATSAAPYFFKPIVIKELGCDITYIDGGLGCNNPTRQLIKEMNDLHLSDQPACILSIGTGYGKTISINKAGAIPKLQLLGVSTALRNIATDCQVVHQELADDFYRGIRAGVYVRLNVEQGMQRIGLQEWKMFDEIRYITAEYLRGYNVKAQLDILQQYIRKRPECQ
ncbi:FabD/lysophospholipase-like protein [Ceratobasidium sp. AG-I]|nr:FabD/lysophospholipase-like protein [Ceratobasidium sp. AG-I]